VKILRPPREVCRKDLKKEFLADDDDPEKELVV
jgi:hypothetical protein